MKIKLQTMCFLVNPTQLWHHKVSSLEHLTCARLLFENVNVHNIFVSGTTLDQVQKLLDKSDSQVDSENVDSVVLSLGTNYVTQNRNDTEQIIVNVTTCVENVKHKYLNANIGVCNIPPRKGKGT